MKLHTNLHTASYTLVRLKDFENVLRTNLIIAEIQFKSCPKESDQLLLIAVLYRN